MKPLVYERLEAFPLQDGRYSFLIQTYPFLAYRLIQMVVYRGLISSIIFLLPAFLLQVFG